LEGEVKYKIAYYGRCGVCGKRILRCKYRTVNWKYVTVEGGRLQFDMADVVSVVRGY